MIKIYTVPDTISNDVERWVAGTKIPWFYFSHTLGQEQRGRHEVDQDVYTIRDMPRLTHYFFPNSTTPKQDIKFIQPLTDWIKGHVLPGCVVRRVMGNLTTQLPGSELLLNIPHVDSDSNNLVTFLYYVNNSDGKTVFFKDKKIYDEVEPVKGTGVLFPSNTVHAGQVPCLNKSRYVINIILSKRD